MISVLILTKNEEANLPGCLDSVAWSDDVVVFDSYSDDGTVDIARERGARVVQHQFVDYGSQREAARRAEYKYRWVLAVDADERPEPELVCELQEIARRGNDGYAAYRVRRKDHFMGKWIKHCTLYPSWFLRFYQPDRIKYEPRAVHEYPTIEGEVGTLDGHLLHYSFNKGLEEWWQKHVRYAGLEAAENLKSLAGGRTGIDFGGLFSTADPVRRRRALKELSFRMPMRPLLRFAYMYGLRGGWLDGIAGFRYCRMLAIYEYMIVLKMRELRWKGAEEGTAEIDTPSPSPSHRGRGMSDDGGPSAGPSLRGRGMMGPGVQAGE
jgi:glycosyltransferase involved in cell wall biosynthesis